MCILEVSNISKTIKSKKIIKNISFSINKGDVFGFIGRNGSGKTTTIRMILGLIKPTGGTIRINNYDIQKDFYNAMKSASGIVEVPTFYGYLTGFENLKQKSMLFNKKITEKELYEIVDLIGLKNQIHNKVSNYSLGMKQRLAIGLSLIGDPELIILDEPINGLDPQGIIEIRNLIKYLSQEKSKAILISSHILSELEQVITKGIIINEGEMIIDLEEHLNRDNASYKNYHLAFDDSKSNVTIQAAFQELKIVEFDIKNNNIQFSLNNSARLQELLLFLLENKIDILQLYEEQRNLESLYLDATNVEG